MVWSYPSADWTAGPALHTGNRNISICPAQSSFSPVTSSMWSLICIKTDEHRRCRHQAGLNWWTNSVLSPCWVKLVRAAGFLVILQTKQPMLVRTSQSLRSWPLHDTGERLPWPSYQSNYEWLLTLFRVSLGCVSWCWENVVAVTHNGGHYENKRKISSIPIPVPPILLLWKESVMFLECVRVCFSLLFCPSLSFWQDIMSLWEDLQV